MPEDVFVNGRFLTQRLSGVQRFGREMIRAVDALLCADPRPEATRGRWFLVAPDGAPCDLDLRAVRYLPTGRLGGHLWEQVTLGRRARGGILVNTGNSAPVWHNRKIVVLHDAAVFRTPENFGRLYGLLHRLSGRAVARRARIGTVSAFSRDELSRVLPIPSADMFLVPNGWEHVARVRPDETVVARLGLAGTRFVVMLGNAAPNKNMARAIRAFGRLDDRTARLVIVGGGDAGVFRGVATGGESGIVRAGRLSDAEIAGLLRQAAGLLFPSLYEGFGIPPLEAMAQHCPVAASDIPVVREVCRDGATYFDPLAEDAIARALRDLLEAGDARSATPARDAAPPEALRHFSWERSARVLIDEVDRLRVAA